MYVQKTIVEAGATFTWDPAMIFVTVVSVLEYQLVCVVWKIRIVWPVNVYVWIIGLEQSVILSDLYVTTVVIHAQDLFQVNVTSVIMVM